MTTLTADQAKATERIKKWLSTPTITNTDGRYSQVFCLRGYAGTGKTFMLGATNLLSSYNTVWSATTNKAAKVLSNSISKPTKTIHSALGAKMVIKGDALELALPDVLPYFPSNTIILCDEVSGLSKLLINGALLRVLNENPRIRALLIGDPAQLPPVGEAISPAWKLSLPENTSTLRECVRFDNEILALSLKLRACIYGKSYSSPIRSNHSNNEGVWKFKTRSMFINSLLKCLHNEDFATVKAVAWRNDRVDEYNKIMRESLGLTGEYARGDCVLLGEPIMEADVILAHTDDEFIVEEVTQSNTSIDGIDIPTHAIVAKGSPCMLNVPTREGMFTLQQVLASKAVYANKQSSTNLRRLAWVDFWNTKRLFHSLRYGFALTAHRAQGSTYATVAVDQEDILANQNSREAFRCLYVGCTRPTTKLLTY